MSYSYTSSNGKYSSSIGRGEGYSSSAYSGSPYSGYGTGNNLYDTGSDVYSSAYGSRITSHDHAGGGSSYTKHSDAPTYSSYLGSSATSGYGLHEDKSYQYGTYSSHTPSFHDAYGGDVTKSYSDNLSSSKKYHDAYGGDVTKSYSDNLSSTKKYYDSHPDRLTDASHLKRFGGLQDLAATNKPRYGSYESEGSAHYSSYSSAGLSPGVYGNTTGSAETYGSYRPAYDQPDSFQSSNKKSSKKQKKKTKKTGGYMDLILEDSDTSSADSEVNYVGRAYEEISQSEPYSSGSRSYTTQSTSYGNLNSDIRSSNSLYGEGDSHRSGGASYYDAYGSNRGTMRGDW